MKKYILVWMILFISLVESRAQDTRLLWNDLKIDSGYFLTQELRLKSLEKEINQNKDILLTNNHNFQLYSKELLDIPKFPIYKLFLNLLECPLEYQNKQTQLEIISIEKFDLKGEKINPDLKNDLKVHEVGVEFIDCQLMIYIEIKDLYSKSFFLM